MRNSKTAGIIIIGNEILSGKVRDSNSFFLACELRELGVDVKRISVIPDDIKTIGNEAVTFSGLFDYVFTSGGVGPTHDDVTMAGIADGFDVKLVEHPDIKNFLSSRFDRGLNTPMLKMAKVPEGSNVNLREGMRFPVVSFKNIYIFPGIPDYIRDKFGMMKEQFRSTAFYLKRLFVNSHETAIAEILNTAVRDNKEVMFGSYPVTGEPEYRVMITVESKSEEMLNKAVDDLIRRLPEDIIVTVE